MKKKLLRKQKALDKIARTETYWVKIDRKRTDGYWNCNEIVYVNVICENNENPKDLHAKASAQVLREYPECRIVSCWYV